MRANARIILIFGLLLIMSSLVSAADPMVITMVSTSNEWPVANGIDQAKITVSVVNTTTAIPVHGATVTFTVDSTMGTISPSLVTTDIFGNTNSTFTVKTRSGTAKINATAQYGTLANTVPTNINQNIDHDSPYVTSFGLAPSATIKTQVPLTIRFTDRWGNLIDSRNPLQKHNVTLHIHGPSPDDCGFADGGLYPHDIARDLDANANVSAIVNLTSRSGSNNILLDRFGSIPDTMKSIYAVSNAEPYSIAQVFDPDGTPYASVIADGTSTFTLYYILYDRFGNPTMDQPLNLTTSANEYYPDRNTSVNGDVWYTYGPKSFTGLYTLTATAVNNNSVSISKVVRFYNSSPSNIELTANPQTMPSRDAKPDISAKISAKVVDVVGNPVSGETVTFDLHDIVYSPGTVGYKEQPSFSQTATELTKTATTGADGIASVNFYPTNFSVGGEAGYEPSATGTGTVTATWGSSQRDVGLTWKNYPYLSASMTISPSQVKVGDTVDVFLRLNGDGWALTSKPIDVVMVTDRSGSMLMDNPDRMVGAMDAAILFNTQMNNNQDRVGLVSFGDPSGNAGWADLTGAAGHLYGSASWAYIDSSTTGDAAYIATHYPSSPKNYGAQMAYLDLPLTYSPISNKPAVDTAIQGMVPSGGTPTREGLYLGVKEVISKTRPGAVKAVILLSDGDFTAGHDPLIGGASFTEIGTGSVVQWAKDNDVRIYTIRLGSSGNEPALQFYASETGGFYRHAPTTAELADIYSDIAGDLRESAGVDTVATMDFGSIVVNDNLDTSGNVFMYVSDPVTDGISTGPALLPLGSTMVAKYNKTHQLIPGPGYSQVGPLFDNMTPYWNSHTPHQLYFNIGEVKINETWETNFRLRVLKEGSISLMGPGSVINFKDVNGATSSMSLNNLSTFTSSQNAVLTGAKWQTVTIQEFRVADEGLNTDGSLKTLVPLSWQTTYTGVRPLTHDIMFQRGDDPEVRFDQKVTLGGGTTTQYAQLDLSKLPPGGYVFQVHAHADDASAYDSTIAYQWNTQTRPFIKLE